MTGPQQQFSWTALPRAVRLTVTLAVGVMVATVLAVGIGNAVSGNGGQTDTTADGTSAGTASAEASVSAGTGDRCSPVVPPTGAASNWAADALYLPAAHQISAGAGVTVAVLDTGLNAVPDLSAVVSPDGVSLVAGEDLADRSGHGTQMAQLVHLAAPAATILPVKVVGGSGTSWPRASPSR